MHRIGLAIAILAAVYGAPAAAQTQTAALAPPPRTISDIKSALDQFKPPDPAKIAADRAAAEAPIPTDLSPTKRIDALMARGKAAGRLGLGKQQLGDMREAARLTETSPHDDKANVLLELSRVESAAGNMKEAIELREKAIPMIPAKYFGRRAPWMANTVAFLASAGQLDQAAAMYAKAEAALESQRSMRDWAVWGDTWTGSLVRAKAILLDTSGKFDEAEREYAKAVQLFDKQVAKGTVGDNDPDTIPQLRDVAVLDRAGALVRLGRNVEAEIEARRGVANRLAAVGRYSTDTALALQRLTLAIAEQGRHEEAAALCRIVLDIYEKIGVARDSSRVAASRIQLARILANQGRWKEARAEFERVRADMGTTADLYERVYGADVDIALAELKAGDKNRAREIAAKAALRTAQRLTPRHYNAAEAEAVLAMTLAATGDKKGALERFRSSTPILLQRSRQSVGEEGAEASADRRRQIILESFIELLFEVSGSPLGREANLDTIGEAFRLADVARGQSVQKALAQSAARASVSDPALADLLRKEQDAQKQIAALNGLLVSVMSQPDSQRDPAAVQSLRANIDKLREERGLLAGQIEKQFPDYAELLNPKPSSLAETAALLKPGEALIAFYASETRTFIWVVPQGGKPVGAAAAMGRDALADKVAALRASLDPNAETVEQIPAFDVAAAHDLYKALLAPSEAAWRSAKTLVVVPHAALGFLPLALLPTTPKPLGKDGQVAFASYRDVPWLARTHAVAQLPSVGALKALRALKTADAVRKPFVGFGDPYFNAQQAAQGAQDDAAKLAMRGGKIVLARRNASRMAEADSTRLAGLPRLADTRAELLSLARAMKADPSDVFLGKDANEQRVKTMALKSYRVLVFATHGLVPGELDGLAEPALALSAPEVAGVDGDGLLSLAEVLTLKLDADWVVLSACNTATGDGAGAEALSGLGRAFFYAGTRAILATNWAVHSASAARLTSELFRRQAENASLGRAEALRQAMLAVIDGKGFEDQGSGRELFAYAHPLFWAPFSLVGDGG